ncbi:tyrosine-type recombinase/integrase [Aliifodinibius sp. S!AR15-10]|uniref:tyrosine-type recombinase/integrase n=1 Tax=Aliifodinibius sp. S!AR15-10 TaxID=2950437 RepID=UPI00286531E3|nr:tyrosine-type recombinase/integrase [Aliifodinibius sp. S!AR15-10]MDR8392254.1 tyrosine-type recombinase/integrase [Aliifodinibius sp. S!AR15-10]
MDFAVYPFKRNNKYRLYVRFEDEQGNRRHLSTGVTYPLDASKRERKQAQKRAEKKATQLVVEYFKDYRVQQEQKNRAMLLSDYLEDYYYPHVRSSCAKTTLTTYKKGLRYFLRIIGDHPIDSYDRQMINEYKLHRFDKEDVRKTTINIELRSIKAAFSWAYKNDYLDKHPYKGQDFMFDAKSKRREFKKKEINRLLKQTEGQVIGLVVRLAYYTGMRIGEMTRITWGMVNLEERYLHLPAEITKTGKDRMIPLGKKAFNIVKILENVLAKKIKKDPDFYIGMDETDYPLLQKQRGHGHYARRSIEQKFRRCMNAAGLPKELTFHCLRHSFATHVLEKEGANIYGVSKIMGHSTPTVTASFYDHTTALNYREIADMI